MPLFTSIPLRQVAKEGFEGHGKEMLVMHTSQEPNKRYFFLREERILLEADTAMFAVLDKTQLYQHKLSFVVDGHGYPLGDFTVFLAKATSHTGNFVGVVLEVEYHPVGNLEAAGPVLTHFSDMLQHSTDKLSGKFVAVDDNFADRDWGPAFSGKHGALQHLNLVFCLSNVLLTPKRQDGAI